MVLRDNVGLFGGASPSDGRDTGGNLTLDLLLGTKLARVRDEKGLRRSPWIDGLGDGRGVGSSSASRALDGNPGAGEFSFGCDGVFVGFFDRLRKEDFDGLDLSPAGAAGAPFCDEEKSLLKKRRDFARRGLGGSAGCCFWGCSGCATSAVEAIGWAAD